MSLLDFAMDFGAGATASLAQSKAEERKFKLEEQRQASLAKLKAQHKREEATALEERRRQAVGDPTELFALTGDLRALEPPKTPDVETPSYVRVVDVESGTIRNVLEGSEEHLQGKKENKLFEYNVNDFKTATDYTGRPTLLHVPTGLRMQLREEAAPPERPAMPTTVREAKETPLYIDSDTEVDIKRMDMADPIERSTGIQANFLRVIQGNPVLGNIWTDLGRLESAANVKILKVRNNFRLANLANPDRPSNYQVKIVDEFLPSTGWFTTTSKQEAEFEEWRKGLYKDIQLQRTIAYDPNQMHTDAERRAARESLQHLEPAYADIMGLLAVRQIRNTTITVGEEEIPLINFSPERDQERRTTALRNRLGRLFGRESHNTGYYGDLLAEYSDPAKVADLRENDPAKYQALTTYFRWAQSQGW